MMHDLVLHVAMHESSLSVGRDGWFNQCTWTAPSQSDSDQVRLLGKPIILHTHSHTHIYESINKSVANLCLELA